MTTHEKVVNLSYSDTLSFAEVARDWNPLHLDRTHAREVGFDDPICHGAMTASLFSARLTEMFGPNTIYVEQYTKFIKPVPVGSTVKVVLTNPEQTDKGRMKVDTHAYVDVAPRVGLPVHHQPEWQLAVIGHATVIPGGQPSQ